MTRSLVRGWVASLALLLLASVTWAQERTCPKCNKPYAASAKFCTDDGSILVVPEKCPKCSALRVGKSKFCASCRYDFDKPPVPTCSKCGRTAPLGTKYCTDCGTLLTAGPSGGGETPAPPADPAAAGQEIRQWVESVPQASSQYGIRLFSKDQIIGPPDVQRPGQDGRAWCPSLAKRGVESIVVQFARPVVPRAVRIHETASQGFVTRVDAVLDGREAVIWEGNDPANKNTPILEVVPADPPPATNRIKITIDTNKVRNAWTEIDAVELIGTASAGGATAPAGALGGDVSSGLLGVRPGSEFKYQVTRGLRTEVLTVRVHHLSDKSVGLAWTTTGDRASAGYVQILQSNFAGGTTYDDRFPEEQAETLATATALWFPRRVHLGLLEDQKARIELAGVGAASLSGANALAHSLLVNGKATRIQVVSSYLTGGGKVTVLDDPSTPLVIDMERSGFRMTLQSADQVGGAPASGTTPSGTGTPGTSGTTPAGTGTPGTTPAGTSGTPTPELPAFATADACFEAWKKAIAAKDSKGLADCYVSAERKAMTSDGDAARSIFDRYGESVEKGRYTIESKKESGSLIVWVVEIRVREVFWTRKAKETFKFVKESDGYRLQIEKDGF